MKNPFGSRSKIVALSLLILAMIVMMYNAPSDIKYWIAVTITFISLILINYEYFVLYKRNNEKK
ncbi:MAG: hypothetical protein ACOYLE_04625 [Bacteroidales bacterium]